MYANIIVTENEFLLNFWTVVFKNFNVKQRTSKHLILNIKQIFVIPFHANRKCVTCSKNFLIMYNESR